MSRFPLEEIENKVGSKYSAVIAIAKRALRTNQRFVDAPPSRRYSLIRSAMEDVVSGRVKVERAEGTQEAEPRGESKEEELGDALLGARR
jgi:DNA-directed RNA polymerase subunit K/omega